MENLTNIYYKTFRNQPTEKIMNELESYLNDFGYEEVSNALIESESHKANSFNYTKTILERLKEEKQQEESNDFYDLPF